jgi:hypothetical protein
MKYLVLYEVTIMFSHYDIYKNVKAGNVIYIKGNRYEVLSIVPIKLTKVSMMLKDNRDRITKVNKMIDTEVIIVD